MAYSCDVCGQTEFTTEAGFSYCVECGTKSQHHGQELVSEYQEKMPVKGVASTKIKKAKKKGKSITSWEQVNYILLGYTDRLISLGAGEAFKLTVLQLWSSYLRRMEIAFFDKEKQEKPKLHVFYKKADAAIIYNRRRSSSRCSSVSSSRRNSSEAASTAGTVVSQRSVAKTARVNKRVLMNAEYDSFLADQRSDLNRSLHDLSVKSLNASRSGSGSDTSQVGQRIRYSRLARIRMKRKLKMSTKHIDKHERDTGDEMACHKSFPNSSSKIRKRNPETLTRMLVSALLGLALNISGSDIQLADLVRYHREEHISHTNLLQYLPEELDPSCYTETLANFQKGVSISHNDLRMAVMELVKFLHVTPVMPDLSKLCKRYLEELCLPADLLLYVERIMAVFPPEMKVNRKYQLPNYEGRVMAYIIFVLKLLFGLNETTEVKMSKSAAKLNRKITNLQQSYKSLFVFTEWARYIVMRKVILGQVHHPINRLVAKEEGVDQDVSIFVDYNLRKKRSADSFRVSTVQANHIHMSKMKDVVGNMIDTHHRQHHLEDCPRSIHFEPSLTPYRSYLETFLLGYNTDGKIHVPRYMHVDHNDRTVSPFVDSSNLKTHLLSNHEISLSTKKVRSAMDTFRFADIVTTCDNLFMQQRKESPFFLIEDCSESDWTPPEKHSRTLSQHEHILNNILIRNEIEQQTTSTMNFSQQEHLERLPLNDTCTSIFSEQEFSQESTLAPNQEALKCSPNMSSSGVESCSLLTPNYDYWLRYYSESQTYSMEKFDEQIAVGFPNNFRLVLEECARVVENRPQVLYRELWALESYFFYAVEPVERFFTGEDDCEKVLFSTEHLGYRLGQAVANARRAY